MHGNYEKIILDWKKWRGLSKIGVGACPSSLINGQRTSLIWGGTYSTSQPTGMIVLLEMLIALGMRRVSIWIPSRT